jgi:hypothetical protein
MTKRILTFVAVAIGIAWIVINLPLRHDRTWIDPITGSMKYETSVLVFSTTRVDKSALHLWAEKDTASYKPKWHFLCETTKNVFDQPLAAGASPAPTIYELQTGKWNSEFVRRSSDQELTDFVKAMQHGDEVECKKLVDAAVEKAITDRGEAGVNNHVE